MHISTRKIAPRKIAPQQIHPCVRVRIWVRVRVGGNLPGGNFPCTTFMYFFLFCLSLTSTLKNIKYYSMQLAYGYGTTVLIQVEDVI